MNTQTFQIKQLKKKFSETCAVDGIDISIKPGEMVGVIGRSGAGKSTLLRMLNRLVDPTDGRIQYGDEEITSLKGKKLLQWRSKCSMIFQQFNLVHRLDVLTNVMIGRLGYRNTLPTLFKWFSHAERVKAIQALERLDMADYALQRADSLSGGQQQRVAIAKALNQDPDVLLADEPIASLDPHNAVKVMDSLKKINEEDGITVICNMHNVPTAKSYCERIIGMANGRIIFDGPSDELDLEKARDVYGADTECEEAEQAMQSHSDLKPGGITTESLAVVS